MKYGCVCGKPHPQTRYRASWVIIHFRCNFSSFNGNRRASSDYSLVSCLKCGRSWRTKAQYVYRLPELTDDERNRWGMRTLTIDQVGERPRERYDKPR